MDIITRLYQIAKSYTNSKFENLHKENAGWKIHLENHKKSYHKSFAPKARQTRLKSIDPVLADYYANLEIPYGSDLKTTKAAWKQLLKKYHPDIHSSDPEKRRIATIVTQKLNEAYHKIEKAITENKI